MAGEARRKIPWWIAWPVSLLIMVGGGLVGTQIGNIVLGSPGDGSPLAQYGEVFSFGVTLLALFFWVRVVEGRRIRTLGFTPSKGGLKKIGLGFLLGGAMMGAGVGVGLLTGQLSFGASTHAVTGWGSLLALLPLVLVFILQGTTEETLTRGYMLQSGARSMPLWLAIIASSVIFALVHLSFEPIILTNIILYAVFACLVALKQNSLWLIAGLHAGWNFFQGNIFGLPVSGHGYATSLLSVGPSAHSTDMLSGGTFGVEGSVFGTLVLGAATLIALTVFLRRPRRKGADRPGEVMIEN
ncbi:CPBP family intramembrane metalloprotease [Microbacterium sp. W1N]|uniref:CPBP family intramembrane glutamic endopeptidase n=1 Tax=Microbacterium festucae TaxID=2977531 RepID=UPI0021C1E0C1|nr:type II CAAX endopeptidase family protein [Microbacterium festucae]MCT9818940.1 CPBP family intramembrane metalloprotease [Microbacterium festucae]